MSVKKSLWVLKRLFIEIYIYVFISGEGEAETDKYRVMGWCFLKHSNENYFMFIRTWITTYFM